MRISHTRTSLRTSSLTRPRAGPAHGGGTPSWPDRHYPPTSLPAAWRALNRSIARVMGPMPPGTGVRPRLWTLPPQNVRLPPVLRHPSGEFRRLLLRRLPSHTRPQPPTPDGPGRRKDVPTGNNLGWSRAGNAGACPEGVCHRLTSSPGSRSCPRAAAPSPLPNLAFEPFDPPTWSLDLSCASITKRSVIALQAGRHCLAM